MRIRLPIFALASLLILLATRPAAAQIPVEPVSEPPVAAPVPPPVQTPGPAVVTSAVPCIDLTGHWAGGWQDTGTGHHGPLVAKVRKTGDGQYHATFTGTFRKVIPFVYSVNLSVTGYEGDRVLLSGTHRSALTGRCYQYEAWATECEFHMTFSSDRYNGHFDLTRKR
jgi:hypothetical protein